MYRRLFLLTPALLLPLPGCTIRIRVTENPLLDMVNTYRKSVNLPELEQDLRLMMAATEHAGYMARHHSLTHLGYTRRLEAAGFTKGGECIGVGDTPATVVAQWAASRTYGGVLRGNWRFAGAAGSGGYWCVTFAP